SVSSLFLAVVSSLLLSSCFVQLTFSNILLLHSKLQSDVLREAISQVVGDSREKKRQFTETVELQIGLKNYDPQKDKRFSGSVKLPHIPRPKMKVCMLGDAQHVEEVKHMELCVGHSLHVIADSGVFFAGEMLIPEEHHGEAIPSVLIG
ncbi:hypothetical protein BHM03_00054523, partial [Ensete ventricosum]